MTKQPLKPKKENMFEEFMEEWAKGHEHILTAATIYVKALNEDPANREIFYKKAKGLVPQKSFQILEAVGRKLLDFRLPSGLGGQHTARIKKLPFDLQTKVLDGCMFEFLTADGSHMMVCLRDSEDWQAKQMFAVDHVRTLPEQKSWIEAEKARIKSTEVVHTIPFEIRKKSVLFEKCELTHEQIWQLALQLRKH